MRLGWAAATVVLLAAAIAHAAPLARTDGGALQGRTTGGVNAFLGVPYAAAPIGPLRWRPPAPVRPWRGVRPATHFARACPQVGVSMPGEPVPVTAEDCLYLNVWAPARHARKAPVIVWIHGGGYANGATSLPLYWGDRLAARGAVVVTLAYRLGPLGWLAHPELSAEQGGASGDYGLMDQIAALAWVKRNATAFGGDPGKITIAGQSAGAMSVSMLMAAPSARGLFQRAIGQSGGLFEPVKLAPAYQSAQAERDGVAYASSVGAHDLGELRALPVAALLKGRAGRVSHPVIGPAVLPQSPYEVFVAGDQARVPVLVGFNAEEARSLSDLSAVRAASFAADLARTFGPLPPSLLAAYPFTTDEQARAARGDLERDLRFGWDMWTWARLQAPRDPTFLYVFARRPPFAASPRADWGASHFAELFYMFDQLDREPGHWTTADRRLADRMARYWLNFARNGDPNGPGLPAWPAFDRARDNALLLDDPAVAGPPPNLAALKVFDATYDAVRGTPFGKARP